MGPGLVSQYLITGNLSSYVQSSSFKAKERDHDIQVDVPLEDVMMGTLPFLQLLAQLPTPFFKCDCGGLLDTKSIVSS